MRLARVTGTVTATAKDSTLSGHKLLLVDIEEASGKKMATSLIAVDTVGAGVGDLCILAEGTAARVPRMVAGLPVDACIIGIVDRVSVD